MAPDPHPSVSAAPSEQPTRAAFWERRIRSMRRRINAAWWLESFGPSLFAAAILVAALTLAGRRSGMSLGSLGILTALAVGVALVVSGFSARRRFVTKAEAQARMESALGLHSRLSAASAGIGPWPATELWKPGSLRWNWRRVTLLPAACVALAMAAFLIPIPPAQRTVPPPFTKPPALAAAESWLDALAQSEAIDPASLEEPREQAEQLAGQAPSEQYSHASLEAADHLRTKLQAGMRALESGAGKLDDLLGEAGSAELSDAQAGALAEQMSGALGALSGNIPGLNRALAGKLREIDPAKLRSLSPEQIAQMQKRLREGRGACKQCLGDGEGDFLTESAGAGRGRKTGKGDIDRGPGTAPITLGAAPADLQTTKTEALESEDFSRAAMGDRVGMSTGAHEPDRTADGRAAKGGNVAAAGAGADAVWVQPNFAPDERRRLREFFK